MNGCSTMSNPHTTALAYDTIGRRRPREAEMRMRRMAACVVGSWLLATASWATAGETTAARTAVVVATTRSEPAGGALLEAIRGHSSEWHGASLVELSVEAHPEHARKLGITRTPTVVVVHRDAQGKSQRVGSLVAPADPQYAASWIRATVNRVGGRVNRGPADPSVVRTGFGGSPSAQATYLPPTVTPQAAPSPGPAVVQQTATPLTLTLPTAPVVVQQQPQTFVVAPAPTPHIIVATTAPNAPTVAYTQAAPPSLFLSPGASQALPAVATAPGFAAPAAAPAAVGVVHPGLLDSLLGTIGEHFARKKWPRVQPMTVPMALTTVPQAVVQQAPVVQQSVPQAAPEVSTQPLASPQADSRAHHGLFGRRR